MTPKLKALYSGLLASAAEMLSYIAAMPPSTQTHYLDVIGDMFPPQWKGPIGTGAKILARIAALYAMIQASHSGPATKPITDTQTGKEL